MNTKGIISKKRRRGETLRPSVFAGIFIGIAGLGYLRLGGIEGAVLFCVGLIGCVLFNLKLYTGMIGFIRWREWDEIPLVILGNICGTGLVALLSLYCLPGIEERAAEIVQARLDKSWFQALLLGIGCGLLMTFAVRNLKPWRKEEEKTWLPLLFAVPVFITCGFLHSIADSFYFWCMGTKWLFSLAGLKALGIWVSVVFGNLIGCNLPRVILINE